MSAADELAAWIADSHEARSMDVEVSCSEPVYEAEDDNEESSPPVYWWRIKATDIDGYYGDNAYSASSYYGLGESMEEAAAKVMEAIAFVIAERAAEMQVIEAAKAWRKTRETRAWVTDESADYSRTRFVLIHAVDALAVGGTQP